MNQYNNPFTTSTGNKPVRRNTFDVNQEEKGNGVSTDGQGSQPPSAFPAGHDTNPYRRPRRYSEAVNTDPFRRNSAPTLATNPFRRESFRTVVVHKPTAIGEHPVNTTPTRTPPVTRPQTPARPPSATPTRTPNRTPPATRTGTPLAVSDTTGLYILPKPQPQLPGARPKTPPKPKQLARKPLEPVEPLYTF